MPAASSQQLLQKLSKGETIGAIALIGSDLYLRDACRAKLIETYVAEGARDWGVARFSLAEVRLDRVLQQCESLPMLTPRQVVFVEELDALMGLGDANLERALEDLEKYLANPAPFTVLVLEAASLDQRTRLFKLLTARTLVVSLELAEGRNEDDRREAALRAAAEFVPRMARELGVEVERDAVAELVEVLNGELAGIRTELAKLAVYAGDRKRITAEDVDALVVSARKYSVWKLAELLAARQRHRAVEFMDGLLRDGEQPAQLVGALAWMYRKLIEAREAPEHLRGWQAARHLQMKQATAELAIRESHRIPREKLLDGLAALYETDSRLKSANPDPRALMEFLVARLTA